MFKMSASFMTYVTYTLASKSRDVVHAMHFEIIGHDGCHSLEPKDLVLIV